MKLLLFLLSLIFSVHLQAQSFQRTNSSVVGASLAHSEAIEDLGYAALHSPAILMESNMQVAISYRQLSAGDFGLNAFDAAFRQKFRSTQHFGIGASYFGNEAGYLLDMNLHYGRKLFDEISIGVQLNFHQRNIVNYEMEQSWSAELALKSNLLDNKLHIGFWARNAIPLADNDWSLSSYQLSGKYLVSEKVALYAGWVQFLDLPAQVGMGIWYKMVDQVDLKLSFYPNANSFVFGIGYYFIEEAGMHFAGRLNPILSTQWMAGAYYQK